MKKREKKEEKKKGGGDDDDKEDVPIDTGEKPAGAAGTKGKRDKDGYPGTRRCYLERRRGMAHGATHYIVYAEDR